MADSSERDTPITATLTEAGNHQEDNHPIDPSDTLHNTATMESSLISLPPFFLQAVLIATLPMFLFGFNTGVLNAPEHVIFVGHSTWQWSLAVSAYSVGGCLGASITGHWADSQGRQRGLASIFWINLSAGLLHTLTPNMTLLIIARLGVGLAGGAATVLTPMYLSEIAPPNIRGSIGTLTQLSCVVGILASVLWELPFDAPDKWRWIFVPIPALAILGIVMAPCVLVESPSWLLLHHSEERRQEALDNLRKVRGLDRRHHNVDDDSVIEMILHAKRGSRAATASDPPVTENLSSTRTAVAAANDGHDEEQEQSPDRQDPVDVLGVETSESQQQQRVFNAYHSFRSYVRDPKNRIPLTSSVLFPVAQQLSGINAVFYYSTALFEGVIADPKNGTILAFTINAVATVGAVFLMDRFGRKTLLSVSAGGMFACCILLTMSLEGRLPGRLTVVGVMMYIIFFELGLGCIPFFLASEMIDAEFVGRVQSISMSCNWLSNFCVGLLFPYMDRFFGPFSFVPFAIVLFGTVFYAIYILPESRGKSPSQVMQDLERTRSGHQRVPVAEMEFSAAPETNVV